MLLIHAAEHINSEKYFLFDFEERKCRSGKYILHCRPLSPLAGSRREHLGTPHQGSATALSLVWSAAWCCCNSSWNLLIPFETRGKNPEILQFHRRFTLLNFMSFRNNFPSRVLILTFSNWTSSVSRNNVILAVEENKPRDVQSAVHQYKTE